MALNQQLYDNLISLLYYYRKALKTNHCAFTINYFPKITSDKYKKPPRSLLTIADSTRFFNSEIEYSKPWNLLTVNSFAKRIFGEHVFFNTLDRTLYKGYHFSWNKVIHNLILNAPYTTKIGWLVFFPTHYIEIIADAYRYYHEKAKKRLSLLLDSNVTRARKMQIVNALQAIDYNLNVRLKAIYDFIDKCNKQDVNLPQAYITRINTYVYEDLSVKYKKELKCLLKSRVKQQNLPYFCLL